MKKSLAAKNANLQVFFFRLPKMLVMLGEYPAADIFSHFAHISHTPLKSNKDTKNDVF